MEQPRVVLANERLCAGSFHNVFIMYIFGQLSVEDIHAAHTEHRKLLENGETGTGVFSVCEPNTPIPGADVRDVSGRLMQELAPHLLAGATVILGGGFWASAVRSFLTAVYFVARQPCPTKAFARIEDGAEWFAPRLQQIPSQCVAAAYVVMAARQQVRAEAR